MAWETVATATVSSGGVQGDIWRSVEELPVGTTGRIVLQAPGIGPIFDAPLVEQAVQTAFGLQGVDITVVDCWGEGLSTAYISFRASPVALVPLLWAVAAVLGALGFLFILVTVSVLIWKAVAGAPGGLLTLLLIGGMVMGTIYLARRRP